MADPIAIYAAVVSTVVFGWDIVKWRRQERLRLVGHASANVIVGPPFGANIFYISLQVDNRGHIPCQISSVIMWVYENRFDVLRKKTCAAFVVIDTKTDWTGQKLPYRLGPGDTYRGLCEQTTELERLSREKLLYIGVAHSMAKRPFMVRLKAVEVVGTV